MVMITKVVQAANRVGIFIFGLDFVACEGDEASSNHLNEQRFSREGADVSPVIF